MSVKKVLIAGGSGLVGRRLTEMLRKKGCEVAWLSRSSNRSSEVKVYAWDVFENKIDESALEGVDAVINLTGAGIADSRWTKHRKEIITESRTNATRLLGEHINRMDKAPKVFIGASAIGFYGDRGEEWMSENSEPGKTGFLPESVREIELAIEQDVPDTIRKVVPRFGVILSRRGGALPKLLMPLKFGISSSLGPGTQYMSWVHIDDVCRFLIRAIEDESVIGTFNITAPNPVTHKQMAKALTKDWNAFSLVLPVPAFVLRLLLGEMADTVLDSTRVRPQRLSDIGFEFHYPDIDVALKDLKSREI